LKGNPEYKTVGPAGVEQHRRRRTMTTTPSIDYAGQTCKTRPTEKFRRGSRRRPSTGPTCMRTARLPDDGDLRRAADLLNAGQKVAILVGQGALNAGDEVWQVAEALGAPVIKALLGKAVVPDDSPYTTGGIDLLGTRAAIRC
jgi:thiamine pyrophosphate-dependent acetolactate synthase large subunit-like protein